ncbi:MAG: hypothetical protein ACLQVW_06270, partial [Limisphaerales bacterium]
MKRPIHAFVSILGLLSALGQAAAQGTAFTYQGQLNDNGTPANGSYDLSFGLFNVATGEKTVVAPRTNSAVCVTNGQFTVILDFGSDIFTGANYWLELSVRTNGSSMFHTLAPRQAVLPTPYAMFAANAGVANFALSARSVAAADIAGIIGFAQLPDTLLTNNSTGLTLSGVFGGDGSALMNLNASQLTGGTLADRLLSANVPLLNGTNAFTGTNSFAGVTMATNVNNVINGTFTGSLTGNVTGNLSGNATTATSATTAGTANNFSGLLAGDVTGTQAATVVSSVGGQTAASVAGGASAANAATSANTAGTIVARDGSGNFAAGTITANLAGNAATATTAANVTGNIGDGQLSANVPLLNGTNAFSGTNSFAGVTMATNVNNVINGTFTGNLTGNVTGNVSGNSSTATSARRAGTANNFSGPLAGDVTGAQGATVVSSVGGQTAASVASGASAANAAASANTAGTIVARDGSGNFVAGTITANLA